MKHLLGMAMRNAEAAEVNYSRGSGASVRFEEGEMKNVSTSETSGYALRVIRDGRLGMSCGTSVEDAAKVAADAQTAAKFGEKALFRFPGKANMETLRGRDSRVERMTIAEVASVARSLAKRLKKLNPSMSPDIYVGRGTGAGGVLNSSGADCSFRNTSFGMHVHAKVKGSKAVFGRSSSSTSFHEFPEAKLDEMTRLYAHLDRQCQVPTRTMDVVFNSGCIWALMWRVFAAANGDALARGVSPLAKKVGKRIFDRRMTITDDPLMRGVASSVPFDDEGVPTRTKHIVKDGVFKGFLFDLRSAAKTGRKSTGNGFKHGFWGGGLESPPHVEFSNLVLAKGDATLDRMISGMEEGIVVEELVGFHAGNIIQGEFSMNVGIGFYVRSGRIEGRAMNAMVTGNIYESFNNLGALGNRMDAHALGHGPAIHVKDVSVAGKG
jgi:PmbA protein